MAVSSRHRQRDGDGDGDIPQEKTDYPPTASFTAAASGAAGLDPVLPPVWKHTHSHALLDAAFPPLPRHPPPPPPFEAPGPASPPPADAIKKHSAQISSLSERDLVTALSLDEFLVSSASSLNEDPPIEPPGRSAESSPPLPKLRVKVSKAAKTAALARIESNSAAIDPRLAYLRSFHQRLNSEPPKVLGSPQPPLPEATKKRAKSVPYVIPVPKHRLPQPLKPLANMDERAAKAPATGLPHSQYHHAPPSHSPPPPPPAATGEKAPSLYVNVKRPSPSISVASQQPSDSGAFSPMEASRVASSQSSWSSYADSNTDASAAPKITTLEAELREMAVQLAASVKREMELEDTVESLHARNGLPHYAAFKYLQQSGKHGQDPSSSPPASLDYDDYDDDEHHEFPRDVDVNISANNNNNNNNNADTRNQVDRKWLEKQRNERANGQEKAFFLSQLTQRYQEEHAKRVLAESQVQTLQAEAQQYKAEKEKSAEIVKQLDELEVTIESLLVEKAESRNSSQKVGELEAALAKSNQSLADMTKQKESLDELVTKLRSEVDQDRAENDMSPRKLASRSSALTVSKRASIYSPWLEEALAAKKAQMQADKMIPTREESDDLPDLSPPRKRESKDFSSPISRMNSLSKRSSIAVPPSRATRPSSVIFNGVVSEYRDSLVKRVDDIESQKKILHSTVKSLLTRHELQEKEHKKKIHSLQEELQALRAGSSSRPGGPHRRKGYVWEVQRLKDDVNQLRVRAMEAMEQKIQCEKGLGGLKMDLDRAEEETMSLRMLLQDHERKNLTDQDTTLAKADDSNGTRGKPLEKFRTSIASLEITYKQLIDSQGESDPHSSKETELGTEVRHQIANHESSKKHIIHAIQRNEEQQRKSVDRINELQDRLKHFEDTLMQAQQYSEEEIEAHDQEVALFQESNSTQLRRVMTKNRVRRDIRLPSDENEEDEEENKSREARKSAAHLLPLLTPFLNDTDGDSPELSATQFFRDMPAEPQSQPKKPVIRPFASPNVPKLGKTVTGKPIPLSETVKIQAFEEHIKRLEGELQVADHDMAEVVSRMNVAQMEVGMLQNNGEEARHKRHQLKAEIQTRQRSLSSSPHDN